jgi:GH24 family phage-related lysozyme (muramidase)
MATTPRKPLTRGQKVGGSIVVAGATLAAASPALLDFLGRWEGAAEYVVYADKLAGGLPTVCKGLTLHITTTPIIVGQRWTPEQCEAEERAAVIKVQTQIAPCFKVAPPQSVFNMATSHAWNFGAARTCGSGAMQAWNRGDWATGCRRISRGDDGQMVWVYAGGKFVKGLANRRAAETAQCLS